MKEILQQLVNYHIWWNNLIMDSEKKIPHELTTKEVASSFNNLFKTITHMWNAEAIWRQRMKLQERIIEPMEVFKGNINEAIEELSQQSKQWKNWIANAQE